MLEENNNKRPTFKLVTKGFDWGPGYYKMVIDLKSKVKEISRNTFKVEAKKDYETYDFSSKEVENHTGNEEITVLEQYLSDEQGNKQEDSSQFVTLELSVHPDNIFTNPFKFSFEKTLNAYEPVDYKVTMSQPIYYLDGEEIGGFVLESADCTEVLESEASLFENDSFAYDDSDYGEINLTYASFVPDTKNSKRPLIILLHGAGEGGTDPRIALYGNKVVVLASDDIQSYFDGAYVLVPQAPTMWMDSGEGEYTQTGNSKYTKALLALIEEYIDKHSIDRDRIYLGGGSNGGYMTMNLLLEKPELFTAAFPICQAYSSEWISDKELERIKEIPIWFVHGENDPVVPFEKTAKDVADRLNHLGANEVKVTTFKDVIDTSGKYKTENNEPYKYNDHWSWIYVYNDEVKDEDVSLFEWLASK